MRYGYALIDREIDATFGTKEEATAAALAAAHAVNDIGMWHGKDRIYIGKFYPNRNKIIPSAEEIIESVNDRIHFDHSAPTFLKPTEEQTKRLQTLINGAFNQWIDDCSIDVSFGDLFDVETFVFDGQQLQRVEENPTPDSVKRAAQADAEAHKSLNAVP